MLKIILTLTILLLIVFSGDPLSRVPWFPTKRKDYGSIEKLAHLKPGLIFYDLGSGTGNMLFYLSKKYNIKCVGIERSPFFYLYSKIKSFLYDGVEIHYGNFLKHDLSKADVVYAFLHPAIYKKLELKIKNNLKNNSKLILACWPLKNLKPTKISKKTGEMTYYLYIIK